MKYQIFKTKNKENTFIAGVMDNSSSLKRKSTGSYFFFCIFLFSYFLVFPLYFSILNIFARRWAQEK